ncbi:MAG: hypothetical protein WCS77_00230 [Elusimicrobiaceae bacterium]|jgi:hypothetical protein
MKRTKVVALVIYASVFSMALVQTRVKAVKTGYDISKIRGQISQKNARNRHLRFKMQELKSPANLEMLAKTRLNMVHPSPCMTAKLEPLSESTPARGNLLASSR